MTWKIVEADRNVGMWFAAIRNRWLCFRLLANVVSAMLPWKWPKLVMNSIRYNHNKSSKQIRVSKHLQLSPTQLKSWY